MPNTQLENELRLRARELIQEGRLPSAPSAHVWGGYGAGGSCALCDQAIGRGEVQYDIELDGAEHQHHSFHVLCHAAWQFECARARALAEQAPK